MHKPLHNGSSLYSASSIAKNKPLYNGQFFPRQMRKSGMDTKFDPFGASMIRCGNKPESSNSFKIKFKYITNLNKNLYFFTTYIERARKLPSTIKDVAREIEMDKHYVYLLYPF